MVCALIFATLHLTSHGVGDAGDPLSQQDECQVCRLNEVAKDVPFTPSLLVSFDFVIVEFATQSTAPLVKRFLRLPGARGPPHTD